MNLLELLKKECDAAGADCFVVGGAIRDKLLNMAAAEIDLIVTAHPEQLAAALHEQTECHAFWLDRQHCMLRLSDGATTLDLAPLSGRLEDNLRQRDFTINAMAQRLQDYINNCGEIIDPFGGRDDLCSQSLRPVGFDSMQADPIRVLRGVRLLLTRDLHLDAASSRLLREAAHLIVSFPAERISQELAKILTCFNASAGLDYLRHLGVVEQILPEVSALQGVAQNNYHQYTVDEHATKAFAAFVDVMHSQRYLSGKAKGWAAGYWASLTQDIRYVIMLAAWLHDIGKPPTRAVRHGKITFYSHELVGASMSKSIAQRLRLSREQSQLLVSFIKYHMYPMQLWRTGKLDDRLLHRYYQRTGAVGVPVVLFTLADHLAKGDAVAESDTFREHVQVVERYLAAWFEHRVEVVAPRPFLTGDEIVAAVGRKPGPWLGKVRELLLEAQAGKQIADKKQAEQFVKRAEQEVGRDQRHR